MTEPLTIARLREVLTYDPEDGVWRWIIRPNRKMRAGDVAGSIRKKDGRREIRIDKKVFLSNRLAFFYMTGEWPDTLIDHEDLDTGNDKWNNLRPATLSQNSFNSRIHRNNTSGYKGVSLIRYSGRWRSCIGQNGKVLVLGVFDTREAAHEAYCAAAKVVAGAFFRAA